MINCYLDNERSLETPIHIDIEKDTFPEQTVWIDLYNLTREEENWIEKNIGFEIPTREEMREIEFSSRLYKKNGSLFMTTIMVAHSTTEEPQFDAVTFILTSDQLITVRYIEPSAFKIFSKLYKNLDQDERHPLNIFLGLLEVAVDRIADTLELVGQRLDNYSHSILRIEEKNKSHKNKNYLKFLTEIGVNGDLNTKVRESLITFSRLLIFFAQASSSNPKMSVELQSRISTLTEDVKSLSDYVMFLSSKVNFLLDATLGLVNIEQNNIIKIFSIAAVIFLPPTLIASIYGMNFRYMPELDWRFGYPFAIGLLIISAWLPYQYFKMRRWL